MGSAQSAKGISRGEAAAMTIISLNSWTGVSDSILDSSIWRESSDTRIVWWTMLLIAERGTGLVLISVLLMLADRAKVSVEAVENALEILSAPDPHSRDKEHEGRRIEEVEGGWRILNHEKYQERLKGGSYLNEASSSSNGSRSPSPNAANKNAVSTKGKENKESFPIGKAGKAEWQPRESWHPTERAAYESYKSEPQRKIFLAVRACAQFAAKRGESDFPLRRELLAKEAEVSPQAAGETRRKMRDREHIAMTKEAAQGVTSQRYRWKLPTTLPIPPYTGEDIEPDDPF